MLQSQLARRRSMAGIFWMGIVAAGAALAFANLYAGLALIALGTLAALLVARADAVALARRVPAEPAARAAAWGRVERLVLTDDAGNERAAILLGRDAESGYATLLTSEGYVVVNGGGERVLPIGR